MIFKILNKYKILQILAVFGSGVMIYLTYPIYQLEQKINSIPHSILSDCKQIKYFVHSKEIMFAKENELPQFLVVEFCSENQ